MTIDFSDPPMVDIVIPLYNKEQVVARAVDSVRAQTHKNWNLTIVDDGSTDNSLARISDSLSDPRVRLVSQPNQGPGAARNRGAEEGNALFLAFLDADDEWEPGFLATSLREFAARADVAVVSTLWSYDVAGPDIREKYVSAGLGFGPSTFAGDVSFEQLKLRIDSLHTSACVIRRDVFERLGGFYDAKFCTFGEDSYLWARLVFSGRTISTVDERRLIFHRDASDLSYGRKSAYPLPPLLEHHRVVVNEVAPALRLSVRHYLERYARFVAHRAVAQRAWKVAAEAALREGSIKVRMLMTMGTGQ